MDPYSGIYSGLLEMASAVEKDPTAAAAEKDPTAAAAEKELTQQFRLQHIGELEAFLRSEVEIRSRILKKYRRAVNVLDYVGVALVPPAWA